ncbi:MAG: PTS-dependent dihydroxyacetone kinase phosphotransferase subunit DhaM [Eubacterium sp.]|nr:PTS-dependent dihydroxyacetone kinase phosphotransferase subunit DhaM [Eubacterium sp.]
MVGIVIVSHCEKLAEGVVDLARLMAAEAPMRAAGGMEDGGFGTSFEKISNAIEEVYSDDGVIILMDMGSAVMTTEMVLEMNEDKKLKMIDCPLVEGAVAASVVSEGGAPFEDVVKAAENAGKTPKF